MKTKNKSVKRKISFEDHIEDRSSVVSKKSNVGHPTTFGCAPPLSYGQDIDPSLIGSSHAAKHEYCQTHVASQLSLAGTSSPKNDTDTHPLPRTPPDVCVHNDTNLHSVATYALTDEYQQCTTTKGVTPAAIRNTQESHVRAPDPGYSRMATSALAISTTNSTNNMDSTQSNSTTPPKIDKSHFHMPQAWRRQLQLEFAAYSEGVNLTLTTYSQHRKYKDTTYYLLSRMQQQPAPFFLFWCSSYPSISPLDVLSVPDRVEFRGK
ncbi:hypothetical protein Tco_0691651 [Tanacetum coccineum]